MFTRVARQINAITATVRERFVVRGYGSPMR